MRLFWQIISRLKMRKFFLCAAQYGNARKADGNCFFIKGQIVQVKVGLDRNDDATFSKGVLSTPCFGAIKSRACAPLIRSKRPPVNLCRLRFIHERNLWRHRFFVLVQKFKVYIFLIVYLVICP